ncbi:PREDICTED: nucleolar protein 58 [Polistes dominula]|uniref:Nucleolar protein 58 n=1 Tax=Polistes dominula TaxID=743375 RepID=A0ABM1IC44_POLDO|nr:PREDICTED: nucleolar protein 58 [Polistes dominula]
MLVLFETPAGYAIFKLLNKKVLARPDDLFREFETPEAANKIVKLKHFEKFENTTEALAATTSAIDGKLPKTLKKVLKKHFSDCQEELAVADAKLGAAIKEKLQLSCVNNTNVQELMRCIRSQVDGLLAGLPKKEMAAMALGLAHSLSRYKLKFSPDKIDTMIVQAVSLLDDLDKELNNYVMRCREWYSWHFPELNKIVTESTIFVKCIRIIGTRENTVNVDLSDILPEDVEEKVKEAAEISMGTEISKNDIKHIQELCDLIVDLSQYRNDLYNYLKTRMMAMAPNLTTLVGDLVGARLISRAGTLINLAKVPASTLQILGAEKALFRALKTKKDTPKYGLIYHSAMIGQCSIAMKGKMSRMLAAKASLAARIDALGETESYDFGIEHKAKLEARLKILEERKLHRISGTGKSKAKFQKYHFKSETIQYPAAADTTLSGKRKHSEIADETQEKGENNEASMIEEVPKKKMKRDVAEEGSSRVDNTVGNEGEQEVSSKKKNKRKKQEATTDDVSVVTEQQDGSSGGEPKKKKKKKKDKQAAETQGEEEEEEETSASVPTETAEDVTPVLSEKKKKKKKKVQKTE